MMQQLRQAWPMLAVAAVAMFVLPRLGSFSTLFLILAILGWAGVIGWLFLARSGFQQLRPVSGGEAGGPMPDGPVMRDRDLFPLETGGRVRKALDQVLYGQPDLIASIATEVDNFVHRKVMTKPLSILIMGPPGSGKTSLAEGLAAALASHGGLNLLELACTSDMVPDLASALRKLPGGKMPVLLLDELSRLPPESRDGAFMTALKRLLEKGSVDGTHRFGHIVVLATVEIGEAGAAQLEKRMAADPRNAATILRHEVATAHPSLGSLLPHLDQVVLVKPLASSDKAVVVWELLRKHALEDYGITLVGDDTTLAGDFVGFLNRTVAAWETETGGAHAAQRFLKAKAAEPLRRARQAGQTLVRPQWDAASQLLILEPATAAQHAPMWWNR